MYGKMIDNKLKVAKNVIKFGEQVVFNPSDALLEEAGYKHIRIESAHIEDGYYAEPYWEEHEKEIVQKWTIKPLMQDSGIPVWDVWQGKRFDVGDECIIEGRIFRSKIAHEAAWNKRPLTGVQWEDYFEEVK